VVIQPLCAMVSSSPSNGGRLQRLVSLLAAQ
jgi:hypothetical protein